MFVVTFYSYKGGVGRTSALVNVAIRLAHRGKRVVVIDFDLEAPGLDSYGLFETDKPRNGVVEYFGQFWNSGEVPKLEDFVIKTKRPGLFFIPAGKKDNQYQTFLSQLNWKALYRNKKGYLLVENLKAAIKDLLQPDYVLLDSRTGLTDVSGICTLQLPDLDVLIFSLNRQNIDGTAHIYQSIRNNKLRPSISVLLVASPVPDIGESSALKKDRFECAQKTIGTSIDVVLPYDPFLAFQESVIWPNESHLARAYEILTDKIISVNPTDVLTLLKSANEWKDAGNFDLAELRFQEIVDSRPEDPVAWLEFAKFARMRDRRTDACRYLEKALSLRPDDSEILAQLATTYLTIDKAKAGMYYTRFLDNSQDSRLILRVATAFLEADEPERAAEGYTRMLQTEANNLDACHGLGESRMRMRHYREATEAYKRAVAVEPTNLIHVYNLGFALSRLGDPRAIGYFETAIQLFEQGDYSSRPATWTINSLEAMSHAYLGVGKPEKAIAALERAIEIAGRLKPHHVYSSLDYKYVPFNKFMTEATQLLERARKKMEGRGKSDTVN